ncbi:MAG TPA: flagellar export chaperone FliS [Nitrospira sp.]|nr:flagellar export chaperone FliS [Nitrospira sp.]
MMTIDYGARQYQQTHVLTTSRVQLIVLLYDSAIQSLELACEGMQNGKAEEKARFLGRAVAIVTELSNVLDFEKGGEIAQSLYRLYDYMLAELLRANLRNNPRHLEGPLKCLVTLREGWQSLARQEASLAAAGK